MFNWIKETVTGTLAEATKLDEAYNEENNQGGQTGGGLLNAGDDGTNELLSELLLPPWEPIPKQFSNDATLEGEWKELILGLTQDENTYLISSSHLKEYDGVWQQIEQYFPPKKTEASAATTSSEATQETSPSVPTLSEKDGIHNKSFQLGTAKHLPQVNELRFAIVPLYTNETNFWNNLAWKIKLFRQCDTTANCLALLQLVNTEPSPKKEDPATGKYIRAKNHGHHHNQALIQNIIDNVNAQRALTQWVAERKAAIEEEILNARNSCQLLQNIVGKKPSDTVTSPSPVSSPTKPDLDLGSSPNPQEDEKSQEGASPKPNSTEEVVEDEMDSEFSKEGVSESNLELAESVSESCKYHKTKVATMLGELSQFAQSPTKGAKLKGTSLELDTGKDYLALFQINQELHDTLERYYYLQQQLQKKNRAGSSGIVSPKQGGGGGGGANSTTAGGSSSGVKGQSASSSTKAAGGAGNSSTKAAKNAESNSFNAQLPWDDDE